MSKSTEKAAIIIGEEISKRRKLANKKQKELAEDMGMPIPQLCKIEKGKNLPSEAVLERIETALGLTSGTLIEFRTQIVNLCASEDNTEVMAPLERLQAACDAHSISDADLLKLAEHLIPRLDEYIALENEMQFAHFCRLGVNDLPTATENHGIHFAKELRTRLRVGDSPLHDILPILEQHNVRILFVPDQLLPPPPNRGRRHSFSFHDTRYDTPVICVNEDSSPVSQLYEIAYELGCYLRYRHQLSNHRRRPINDESEFCRAFAGTLLIPTDALFALLDALNLDGKRLSADMIDAIAARFGVSSLAMIYRLQSIKRIDPTTFEVLNSSLRSPNWHATHGKFPDRAALPRETWLKLLRERAKLGNEKIRRANNG